MHVLTGYHPYTLRGVSGHLTQLTLVTVMTGNNNGADWETPRVFNYSIMDPKTWDPGLPLAQKRINSYNEEEREDSFDLEMHLIPVFDSKLFKNERWNKLVTRDKTDLRQLLKEAARCKSRAETNWSRGPGPEKLFDQHGYAIINSGKRIEQLVHREACQCGNFRLILDIAITLVE